MAGGFGAGLARALTSAVVGYGQGEQENQRALIAAAARKNALDQQAYARQKDEEERQDRRARELRQDVIAGYDPGGTDVSVAPVATPEIPAARELFTAAALQRAGREPEPSSSLTAPIDLGNVPRTTVTTRAPSFTDPLIARAAQQRAAQVAERQTRLTGLNDALPSGHKHKLNSEAITALAGDDAAYNEYLKRATGLTPEPRDPLADHRANRDYDRAHPLKDPTPQGNAKQTAQVVRLSGQFDADPIIKDGKDLAMGVAKVLSAAKDPSAGGDMALLYGFNKILDPGSVVRESEFAAAAKAGSLDQRIAGMVLKVVNGQRLTPEQRQDFVTQARKLAAAQQGLVRETMARHSARAQRMGMDPRDVVYDPFDGIETATPAAPARRGAPAAAAVKAKYKLE